MQTSSTARRPGSDGRRGGSTPVSPPAHTRRLRLAATAAVALLVVIAATVTLRAVRSGSRSAPPSCRVGAGSTAYTLELDQAANATTIAAVGKRLGLPDHAVTIAVAAAVQESKLHNLNHGDRDSLGLFQQRPSQGWGTPSQILTPRLAATAFYQRLALIDGWQGLSVTDAAQQVQQSGAPNAYAFWESEARALAVALTGETPAGLTCHFHTQSGPVQSDALALAMSQELGHSGLGSAVTSAQGWATATWLVGHANQYRIPAVAFGGQRWTPAAGAWKPDSAADSQVRISLGALGRPGLQKGHGSSTTSIAPPARSRAISNA
jgi:hypothetical protein